MLSVLLFVKLSCNATTPVLGSAHAAGFDLSAANACRIRAGGRIVCNTDLQIQVPAGTYGRIAPRSGLAINHCIDVGAGVIDRDYRGNVGVVLINNGAEEFLVARGDRIAQIIFEKIAHPEWVEVMKLSPTDRAANGFGSTGIR